MFQRSSLALVDGHHERTISAKPPVEYKLLLSRRVAVSKEARCFCSETSIPVTFMSWDSRRAFEKAIFGENVAMSSWRIARFKDRQYRTATLFQPTASS